MPHQLTQPELYLLQIVEKNKTGLGLLINNMPAEEMIVMAAYIIALVEAQVEQAGAAFDEEIRPFFREIYPQLVAQTFKERGETPSDDFVIVIPHVEKDSRVGLPFDEPEETVN